MYSARPTLPTDTQAHVKRNELQNPLCRRNISLTQSHQVFCRASSVSYSLHFQHVQNISTFLITKLTASSLNSSLSSSLFFLSFSLTQHCHLTILISVRFNFTSCSAFIGQVSLSYIKQLLTQVGLMPFSFNEKLFQLECVSVHETFSMHI